MTDNNYKLVHLDLSPPQVPERTIQSTTLANVPHLRPILFKFSAGESLSEHTSSHPAVLIFLSGQAHVTLGDDHHDVEAGSWVYMPPHLPHSILAQTPVTMLLEMIL